MFTVYKITNLINQKCYIGSSQNVYERWNEHKNNAKKPSSNTYNYPLQCAFRKYGEKNFKFEILKEGFDNRYDCEEYEHDMIIKYNSLTSGHGYNQTEYTHNGLTDPLIRLKSIKEKSQPCAKVDFNENILIKYNSYQEASREEGYQNGASAIRKVCKGMASSLNGVLYRDLDENGNVIHIDLKRYKGRKKIIGIKVDDPSTKIYFNSISEAANLLNISRKNISSCVNGDSRYSIVKGFIFRELDMEDNIIPNQIDIQWRINKYNETNPLINGERHSITEWCKIYNISKNSYYKRINKGMGVIEAIITPKKGA